MHEYHNMYRNHLNAYIVGLSLKPYRTYRFSMMVLGGKINVYISARGVPLGNRLYSTEHYTNWTPLTFEFTTDNSPALAEFTNWGIALFRSDTSPNSNNNAETYIDNVSLVAVDEPEVNLIDGGTFEAPRRNAIYEKNWNRHVLGSSGKAYGIRLADDPIAPNNRCLLIPSPKVAPYAAESPLVLDMLTHYGNFNGTLPCVHKGNNMLFLVVQHGRVTVDSTDLEGTDGHIVFLPQGESVAYTFHSCAHSSHYRLGFSGSALPFLCNVLQLSEPCVFPSVDMTSLVDIIKKMIAVPSHIHLQQLTVDGLAMQWLGELEKQRFSSPLPNKHTADLDRIAAKLREHPEEDISNEALAAECGMSKTHFVNLFRSHTGSTPHRYRLQQLMGKACKLLLTTEKTIQEIAYTLEIDDPQYFSRLFRSVQGCTPREYRKQYR